MIECRGRNGWFVLHEAKVVSMALINPGHVAVSMRSKRQYLDMPPIYFRGPRTEIIALLEKLLKEVKESA